MPQPRLLNRLEPPLEINKQLVNKTFITTNAPCLKVVTFLVYTPGKGGNCEWTDEVSIAL